MDIYTVPLDTPIVRLEVREAFDGLTEKERLYCYYLTRAAWEGSVICLLQTSPESPPIFLLLRGVLGSQSLHSLREATQRSLSDEEFKVFVCVPSSGALMVKHLDNSAGYSTVCQCVLC